MCRVKCTPVSRLFTHFSIISISSFLLRLCRLLYYIRWMRTPAARKNCSRFSRTIINNLWLLQYGDTIWNRLACSNHRIIPSKKYEDMWLTENKNKKHHRRENRNNLNKILAKSLCQFCLEMVNCSWHSRVDIKGLVCGTTVTRYTYVISVANCPYIN